MNLYYSNLYFHATFESEMPPSSHKFKTTHFCCHLSPIHQHSMTNPIPEFVLKMGCRLIRYSGVLAVFFKKVHCLILLAWKSYPVILIHHYEMTLFESCHKNSLNYLLLHFFNFGKEPLPHFSFLMLYSWEVKIIFVPGNNLGKFLILRSSYFSEGLMLK